MTAMIENPALDTWWLSFPADAQGPIGIGVTARSLGDACELASRCAFGPWLVRAIEVRALRGVRIADLDAAHVLPNCGPMQFRGVWYPPDNIGFAGGAAEYVRLSDDAR